MFKLARLVLATTLVAALPFSAVNAQLRELKIVVPAAPGGGWDYLLIEHNFLIISNSLALSSHRH